MLTTAPVEDAEVIKTSPLAPQGASDVKAVGSALQRIQKSRRLAEGLELGGRCRAVVLHVSLVLKAMGGYSLKASLQYKEGKNVTKGDQQDG